MEKRMDSKIRQENSREFDKILSEFKVKNNISNNDIVKLLVQKASAYQMICNNNENIDDIIHTDDVLYNKLRNLYDLLECTVIDYIIENPELLTVIINERNQQMNDPNWVNPNVYPFNSFSIIIEDIISKLKGKKEQSDLYCGFTIGNKNISIC